MELVIKTILTNNDSGIFSLTLNRVLNKNRINAVLISELNNALDVAETDSSIKVITIEGQAGYFCTGMDFNEALNKAAVDPSSASRYMEILKRISLFPKIIVSKVDGQVTAGGIGLLACSDYVIATSRSKFSLSEALWGLVPACVLPYLIRRVGFQIAYRMSLTTQVVSAEQAYRYALIDEVDENPDNALRKLYYRISKLESKTVSDLKLYFRKLWIISSEVEKNAVSEITRLIQEPKVVENIRNYIDNGTFPWEKDKNL